MPSTKYPRKEMAIFNLVLNYLHTRGIEDYDNFAMKLTNIILQQLERKSINLKQALRQLQTSFFSLNEITKEEFYDEFLEQQLLEVWQQTKERPVDRVAKPTTISEEQFEPQEITIEDIDSFSKVKSIPPESVAELVPLDIKEQFIKESFATILGEQYVPKDWGGEYSDLHTTHLVFKGKGSRAVFLLKGRGTKGPLSIKKCGTHGDQILRLTKQMAKIYVIQHVDKIRPEVTETIHKHLKTRETTSNECFYCMINGIETARILVAYGLLST